MSNLESLNIQQKITTLNDLWNNKYTEEQKEISKQKFKTIKQWFKDNANHIRNLKTIAKQAESKGDKYLWDSFTNWEEVMPEFRDSIYFKYFNRRNNQQKNDAQNLGKMFSVFICYVLYYRKEQVYDYEPKRDYIKEKNVLVNNRLAYSCWDLSEDYRHKHIAWSLLKGTPYDKIEKPHEENQPNWNKIEKYVNEYFKELSITEETLCVNS